MVSPVRATRIRAPGGSFIWPKTSAVFLITPDSFISCTEVVALAGALAHAGEHGDSRRAPVAMLWISSMNQHGLAHAGAAEQADLAALGVGGEQVDDLDAGLQHLHRGALLLESRGIAVDGPALLSLGDPIAAVDGFAQHIKHAAQGRVAHGHRDGAAGVQ